MAETKTAMIVRLKESGHSTDDIARMVGTSANSVRVLWWKHQNPDAANKMAREWCRKNPDKVRAQQARYIERKGRAVIAYRKKLRSAGVDSESAR